MEIQNRIKIEGKIANVIFHNEENAFVVLRVVASNGRPFIATGVCPDLEALPSKDRLTGLNCILQGNWVKHPKHGEQFDAKVINIDNPGLYYFLTNVVSGIGPQLAKQIIKHYGEAKLTEILENTPEQLLEVKGIKHKKLAKIIESWNKYKSLKRLSDFFSTNEVSISSALLLRIYNHFKSSKADPVQLIKQNPYCLTEVRGIGFKTADKIALQLQIDPYSPLRIKALIDYILLSEASDNGHTYLLYEDLLRLASEYISNKEKTDENRLHSVMKEIILSDEKTYYVEGERVALQGFKYMEQYIENDIKQRIQRLFGNTISKEECEKFIKSKEKELGIKLGEKQRLAVEKFSTEGPKVFILCGYAGTGKSTISKILLDYCATVYPKENIITCAFTGMAAKRIRETTGYKGGTIHSLLGYNPETGGFMYNKDNPLPYDVVLIDEASMINLPLFYSLMRAIKPEATIIMVGDDAQLPPIGEGNVFADLLGKSYIPKVKLDKIYRQSEDSVLTYFASYIRQGEVPDEVYRVYKDFEFLKQDIPNYWGLKKKLSEREMQDKRQELYEEIQKSLLARIQGLIQSEDLTGLKKIWRIQVITPMKNTILGTKEMNQVLQGMLNSESPKEVEIRGYKLKQFDKVIHLKNQDMVYITENQYKIGRHAGRDLLELRQDCYKEKQQMRVYNGNLGLVWDIDEENEVFIVYYPDLSDEPIFIFYDFDDYKNILDLGYALTIHKVQGNQFDYVVIPFVNAFYIMLNNKLLYTAITRAKKKAILIGQPSAFKRACTNVEEAERNTFLKGRI